MKAFLLRKKRVLLPVFSVVAIAVAVVVAVLRSDTSRIIVYNETGERIAGVKVSACGQAAMFRNLEEQDSVRWKLSDTGGAGEIELETAAEPPVRWKGGYIEPHGGYVVTLRLWSDGSVEVHTQISLLQHWFRGSPAVNE